jgi:uncharacterized membrane protein YfcA
MKGLFAVLIGHLAELAKLRAYAAALFAAAAGSLLFAIIFGLVALHNWLFALHVGYPDLWIALGFIVVTLICGGLGVWMWRQRPKRHPVATIAVVAAPPAARLAMRAVSPGMMVVGAVLIIGLIAGRRLTAR